MTFLTVDWLGSVDPFVRTAAAVADYLTVVQIAAAGFRTVG